MFQRDALSRCEVLEQCIAEKDRLLTYFQGQQSEIHSERKEYFSTATERIPASVSSEVKIAVLIAPLRQSSGKFFGRISAGYYNNYHIFLL